MTNLIRPTDVIRKGKISIYQIESPLGYSLGQVAMNVGERWYVRYMRQPGGRYVLETDPPLFDTREEAVAYIIMMADRT